MKPSLRWLIAEDALSDKKGHWAEYIGTFQRGLLEEGDSVEILCGVQAEGWVVTQFGAKPVLPPSIWHRVSDGSGKITRLARIPLHGWKTYWALRRYLSVHPDPDIIFVPTVLVHHLLGWWRLIEGPLRQSSARVLLFFPNTPVRLDGATGKGVFSSEPTALLFRWLVRRLAPFVRAGRVILGAETRAMRAALEEATGVPFVYLPHPVSVFAETSAHKEQALTLAAYGPARHEKGSDLLQDAIAAHLKARPASSSRFVIQWLADFADDAGHSVCKRADWDREARVKYLGHYFEPGEYAQRLAGTDVFLLPYRKSSYDLRVSRVVIEAMVHGIPIIATAGTTLAEQAQTYGACVLCGDGSVESLVQAIAQTEDTYASLQKQAAERVSAATAHFSVENFRGLLFRSRDDSESARQRQ